MSQQVINNGQFAGDQSAEPFFTAFSKTNANFTDLYAQIAALIAAGSSGITGFSLTGDATGTYANGTVPVTISAGAVTLAKMANLAAASLIGNNTGSAATPVAITLGATLAFVSTALQTAALTGDVTAAANSFATTVAKIQGNAVLSGVPTNNQALIWNNGATQWQATSRPYDVNCYSGPGVLTASQELLRLTFNRSVQFPSSLTGSNGTADTASSGTATLNIAKNGTNVGTVVFTSSATATFTMSSATTFAAGDVMTIKGPSSADAALAGVSISLAGVIV